MGPIAGSSPRGSNLATLFINLGLGEGFANFVMILLLAAAAFFVFRLIFRRGAETAVARQPCGGDLRSTPAHLRARRAWPQAVTGSSRAGRPLAAAVIAARVRPRLRLASGASDAEAGACGGASSRPAGTQRRRQSWTICGPVHPGVSPSCYVRVNERKQCCGQRAGRGSVANAQVDRRRRRTIRYAVVPRRRPACRRYRRAAPEAF